MPEPELQATVSDAEDDAILAAFLLKQLSASDDPEDGA